MRTPHDRLYPSRPILAVSIAVFRAGKALLARRTRPPYAGAYSLPGGVVELGETLHEAALRELAEELGVRARILGLTRHIESIRRDARGLRHHYVIASFYGEWTGGRARASAEAQAPIWAAPAEVKGLKTTPGLAAMLRDAARAMEGRR